MNWTELSADPINNLNDVISKTEFAVKPKNKMSYWMKSILANKN